MNSGYERRNFPDPSGRQPGGLAETLARHYQTQAYEKILALDLSQVLFAEIDGKPFFLIALEIAEQCPVEVRRRHTLSLLCLAWVLKAAGKEAAFAALMAELDKRVGKDGILRAEWLLLSAYRHFPRLEEMFPPLREAAAMFAGTTSRVVLPDAPWCFGNYSQISEFHPRAGEADREADRLEEFLALYSPLTNGHGRGADALFRGEIAYYRGDIDQAESRAYQADFVSGEKRQTVIQLGAARLLADIALIKADSQGWHQAVDAIDKIAGQAAPDNYVTPAVMDTLRGSLLVELHAETRIAPWLKEADFYSRPLLPPMRDNALYVHVMFLLKQNELARFIGTQEAIPREVIDKTAFAGFLFQLLMAVGHLAKGDRSRAAGFLKGSAAKALPDGFILPFAATSWVLDGLVEEVFRQDYPEWLGRLEAAKARFGVGWEMLHNSVTRGELPADLTAREREIALLAAEGLRNGEIARKLFVTESTVRTHLRNIFQKLAIDRRAKLAEKLAPK